MINHSCENLITLDRKLFKCKLIKCGMNSKTTNVKTEDLAQLKRDVELIKNVLLSEGELTDWAKSELADARNIPESECISHEDVKKMLLQK